MQSRPEIFQSHPPVDKYVANPVFFDAIHWNCHWFYAQLGIIYFIFGKYDIALSYFEKSLLIAQEQNNRQSEATALLNTGQIHEARGNYETALQYLEQSLEICREIGDRKAEA
jgi:Tetratricopeptide repeat.